MNQKSLQIVSIFLGLVFAGLVTRNGDLLILAIPFLAYLLVGLLHAPAEISLQAVRILDKSSVIAHEPVAARVIVENQGTSLLNLYLKDELFATMKLIDGTTQHRNIVFAGQAMELAYRFEAERGVYTWKTIRACASDPFGLFEVESAISASGELFVRPAPLSLRPITLQPRATLPTAGPIPARRPGLGTDFWGVRQYRVGDTLRWINWRLAARYPDTLFTNEFEREEIADFGLIVDARKLTGSAGIEETLFEHSISAAASLAENFLRHGNRVSLMVFGNTILTTFPGYGKGHYNVLLRNLALAELGGDLSFSHLKNIPVQLFPRRSLLIVFSTVEPRDTDTYAHLRSSGYDVFLISPDPVTLAAGLRPPSDANNRAARAARIERVIQLNRLRRLGVHVVDWQVDKPLEPILKDRARQMRYSRN